MMFQGILPVRRKIEMRTLADGKCDFTYEEEFPDLGAAKNAEVVANTARMAEQLIGVFPEGMKPSVGFPSERVMVFRLACAPRNVAADSIIGEFLVESSAGQMNVGELLLTAMMSAARELGAADLPSMVRAHTPEEAARRFGSGGGGGEGDERDEGSGGGGSGEGDHAED